MWDHLRPWMLEWAGKLEVIPGGGYFAQGEMDENCGVDLWVWTD